MTEPAIDVQNCNATFKRYPVTVEDKGWVYGVWYCGTSWDRVRLHGQYPPTFLKRALSLFPNAKDILHCPSGTVTHGTTVDLMRDEVRQPQIRGLIAVVTGFQRATRIFSIFEKRAQ
jgi:hypothetical protein